MRLVTFRNGGAPRLGVRTDEGVIPSDYCSVVDLLAAGEDGLRALRAAARRPRRHSVVHAPQLLAPVPLPVKLLCCGLNYAEHLEEYVDDYLGGVTPDAPPIFAKLSTSVIGPGEPIIMPTPESKLDYEVELALVIGRRAKHVSAAQALEYVFGYTVVNDVSARDVQFARQRQLTLGKGMDSFCPMGPELVLTDEIPDPSKLNLRTTVNGHERQSAPAAEMLTDVQHLIEFVSASVTLEPGDVLATGSPAGAGHFRKPPLYLQPGDEVTVEVDGVGKLTNPVIAGW